MQMTDDSTARAPGPLKSPAPHRRRSRRRSRKSGHGQIPLPRVHHVDQAAIPGAVGLQWQLLEVERLEPAADLSAGMAAVIARLEVPEMAGRGDAGVRFHLRPPRCRAATSNVDRAGSAQHGDAVV
jgi:hypothetical protein